jgi:hypothetical protein
MLSQGQGGNQDAGREWYRSQKYQFVNLKMLNNHTESASCTWTDPMGGCHVVHFPGARADQDNKMLSKSLNDSITHLFISIDFQR